jgi:Recombinase zinc beta ribbon domain/Recombinase
VQEVFSRRAGRKADGSWAKLAQYLTAEGAPNYLARAQAEREGRPATGTRWSAAGVKSIVANRAYLGEARSGSLIKPGAHPALVDQKTWLAANRKGPTYGTLADRKDGPLLGRGLLRCGTCGGGLVRSISKSKRVRRYEYYRCPAPTCKPRATIMAQRIEQYLIHKAFQRLNGDQVPKDKLFSESENCEFPTSGPVAVRLVPRDVASAREFLREVLGSVTVYPVKHLGAWVSNADGKTQSLEWARNQALVGRDVHGEADFAPQVGEDFRESAYRPTLLGISLAPRWRDADRPRSVKPSPIASASWRLGAVASRATQRPETWVEQSSASAEFRAVCRLP